MSERRWDIYVRDMLDCCTKIEDYTAGLSRDQLVAARLNYDAVLWNITVLGEAANKVPGDIQMAHPEIPWANITGTRHRVVHGYGSIHPLKVWEIVTRDLPELMPQLRALLAEAEAEGGADPP